MAKYLVLIIWFSGIFIAFSQEPPAKKSEVDQYIDEFLLEDESMDEFLASLTNFQFLYISVNFNSDTYFSGRDIDIDQYNIVPQITYSHSKGFYGSLSGIYYSEFIPHWDVTTLTAGYGRGIGKNKIWNYYGSYSHYFYSNDIDNLYASTLNAGIGIRNKKRNLGTQLSGAYYFGDEVTYQIVLRSYAHIKLIKTKKHNLKLRPQLSIVTGTQIVDLSGGSIQRSVLIKESEVVSENVILEDNVFGLINTQINLPIQYSTRSFDFELGFHLNIPSELGDETDLKPTNFLNIGIAYLIDL